MAEAKSAGASRKGKRRHWREADAHVAMGGTPAYVERSTTDGSTGSRCRHPRRGDDDRTELAAPARDAVS